MYSFFAGQGDLPAGVSKRMQQELMDHTGSGPVLFGVELSLSTNCGGLARVQDKLKRLLKLPSGANVVLLKGGGSPRLLW